MSKTTARKKNLSNRVNKNIFVAVMLLIPIAHFAVFYVGVNFNSFFMAFQKLDPGTGKMVFTFENFKEIFRLFGKYGELTVSLTNTFLTSGFLILFLLPWGFLAAYFLHKKVPLGGFWRTMLFLPTIIPAIAMTSIFIYLIHPDGPVGKLWELFGSQIPALLVDKQYAKWTVILFIFWTNFGGQFLLFSGAMSRLPKEVLESARVDGAGMRVELLRIILPLCWPTISMLLLINIAGILTATGPLLLLTKGGAFTKTMSYWIFERVYDGSPKVVNEAAAIGLIGTAVVFPTVMLARRVLSKVYADVDF